MATPSHIGQRDPADGSYNPGIQTNVPPVVRDNNLYDTFTADITSAITLGSGNEKYQQDLFNRSPLSGVLGFWNLSTKIVVTVSSPDVPSAPAITHTYSTLPINQPVIIPCSRLSRPASNHDRMFGHYFGRYQSVSDNG